MMDVLHFYLGCDMLTNEGIARLVSVSTEDQEAPFCVQFPPDHPGDPDFIEWGKPILRPFNPDVIPASAMDVFELCKLSVDLFGGIEAGWAISIYKS